MINAGIYDNFEEICISANKNEIENYVKKFNIDINYDNGYFLEIVAGRNDIQLLDKIIELGGDIHSNNDSILRLVAHRGNVEILDYIIKHGGNYKVLFGSSSLTNYETVKKYIDANYHTIYFLLSK